MFRSSCAVFVLTVFIQFLVFSEVESVQEDNTANELLKKVISKTCSRKYTMTCFKMDMVELVDMLSESKRYQLFPGVAVVTDNSSQESVPKKFPEKIMRSLARDFPNGEESQLDDYLVARVGEYLSTHSISLQLMDKHTAEKTRQLGLEIFSSAAQGRKGGGGGGGGKGGYGNVIAGIMMMKGTLMTIGFGALAALAGKALMTGLLSLMLSAIVGLKGHGGGGHKQTTYEIISKPHYSHSHTHSSEVQHGHHDDHSFGRNLDAPAKTKETKTFSIEYVDASQGDPAEGDHKYAATGEDFRTVEYKTISEEDLKNALQYGYYDYSSSLSNKEEEEYTRSQKSLPERKQGFVPSVQTGVYKTST